VAGPDDRLRETHRLLLYYARAVTNYRQNFICGGSFFFMVRFGVYPLDWAGDAADNRSSFGER
jgi:hypothetical protein